MNAFMHLPRPSISSTSVTNPLAFSFQLFFHGVVRPPIRVPHTLDDLNDNVCDDLMRQPILKARVSPNNQAQDRISDRFR